MQARPVVQVQAVRKLMRDHGKEGSPKDEFKALLASGLLSPAMHQFLTSTLGTSHWQLHTFHCTATAVRKNYTASSSSSRADAMSCHAA